MRHFNLVKSLTRVINNYKGLLILCLSLAVFGINEVWGTYYGKFSVAVSTNSTGKGTVYAANNNSATSGENSVSISTGTKNGSVSAYAFAKSNAGYHLQGWSQTDGGSNLGTNNPYTMSGNASSDNNGTKDNGTWYATFAANTYTITFDKNGGTTDANPTTGQVTFDANYTNFPTNAPTYTGYSFNGWWTEKTGGTQVTSNTKVSTASDHTLYAHWTANQYKVTYDAQEGLIEGTGSKTIEETYDGKYTCPTPTREGYDFQGWFTETSGGGSKITTNSTVQTASAHTLYAHWQMVNVVVHPAEAKTVNFTNQTETLTTTLTFSVEKATSTSNFNTPTSSNAEWKVTDYSYSNNVVTVTLSFTATENTTTRGDHISTITLTAKNNASNTGTVTAHVAMTPVLTDNVPTNKLVDDAAIDLNTLWTSTSNGAKTYTIKTWTPDGGAHNGGAVTPAINGSTLSLGDAGKLVLQLSQAAGTSSEAKTAEHTLTINRRDNTLYANNSTSFNPTIVMDATQDVSLTATNTDYSGSPITATQTEGTTIAVLNAAQTQVTSNHNLGTATWTLSQPENYKYKAGSGSFSVTVAKAGEATDCYVLEHKEEGTLNTIQTGNWIEINGPANILTFEAWRSSNISGTSYLYLDYAKDNDTGNPIAVSLADLPSEEYTPFKISLPISTTHIRFRSVTGATGQRKYKNVFVTRATYLEAPAVVLTTATRPNEEVKGELVVNWSCANGGDLKIANDNSKFTLSQTKITDVDCKTGSTKIAITYSSAEVGDDVAHLVIYNDVYRTETTITGKTEKLTPVITWTPDEETFNKDDELIAESNSTGEVTLSVAAEQASYVTIDGNKLTITGVPETNDGKLTITATVAEDENYNSKSETKTIIVTNKTKQYITWNQSFGNIKTTDADITLAASVESGLPCRYTCDDTNGAVVKLLHEGDTWTLQIISEGEANITAYQDGNEDYAAASSVTKHVLVYDPTKPCPTGGTLLSKEKEETVKNGDSRFYSVMCPKSLTFSEKRANVLTIPNLVVYQKINGEWKELYEQSEFLTNYKEFTLTAANGLDINATEIEFRTSANYGHDITGVSYVRETHATPTAADSYSLNAMPGKTDTKSFTIDYSNVRLLLSLENADNTAFSVSPIVVGDCGMPGVETVTITYAPKQGGSETNTLYIKQHTGEVVKSIALSGTATKISQQITKTSLEGITSFKTTDSYELKPEADSKLTEFVYTASPEGVAEFDGNVMTFKKSCDNLSITITQPGNTSYEPCSTTVSNIKVNKVTPTITTLPTAGDITYGAASNTSVLTGGAAKDDKGNAVDGSFVWEESETKPTGGTHSYTVRFKPTKTDWYNDAVSTDKVTLTVNKADQMITWETTTNISLYTPSIDVLNATTTGDGSIVYTIDPSSGDGVGTITNNVLTLHKSGTLVINANAAATTNFNAATQVQKTFEVGKRGLTIVWEDKEEGSSDVITTYAAGSGDIGNHFVALDAQTKEVVDISITITTSSDENVISIEENKLYVNCAGTATITATTAATDQYGAGSGTVTLTSQINTPVFTWQIPQPAPNSTYTNFFTSSNEDSDCQLTFSSNSELVKIEGGKLIVGGNDQTDAEVKITVKQTGNCRWEAHEQTFTIHVKKPANHVPFTIDSESKYKEFKRGGQGNVSWANNNNGMKIANGAGGWGDDNTAIIAFTGIPDKLSFSYFCADVLIFVATQPGWWVKESEDGVNWPEEKLWNETSSSESAQQAPALSLKPKTRYLMFCYSGNFSGVFKNINVTELKHFYVALTQTATEHVESVDMDTYSGSGEFPVKRTIYLRHANAGSNLQIKIGDTKNFRLEYNISTGTDQMGDDPITIIYEPTDFGTHNTTLTISDGLNPEISINVLAAAEPGAPYTFIGEDGDAGKIENWEVYGIPAKSLPNAFRPVEVQKPMTISSEMTFYQLEINVSQYPNAKVTIAPTGGLTIVGSSGIKNATVDKLIIQSSIEGQGYLRISPKYTGIMPSATVQYATKGTLDSGANKDATWQYFGVAVDGVKFTADYITWLYDWDETQGWVNLKDNQEHDLKPFHGYAITQYGQPIYDFQGQLLRDEVEITLTKTPSGMDGENMIANSFSAPIDAKRFDANDFVAENLNDDLDLTFYLFNSGSWNEWNTKTSHGSKLKGDAPGTFTAIPLLSSVETGAQSLVAPGQGICIRTYKDGTKIKLNYEKHVWYASPSAGESMNAGLKAPQRNANDEDILTGNDAAMAEVERDMHIRDSIAQADQRRIDALRHRVRLDVYGSNSGADHLFVLEKDDYTTAYDNGCDAPKMFADGLANIYANEVDGLMSVAATNDVNEMFIGFNAGEDYNYELFVTSVIGDNLELMDMQTGDRFALADSASYEFAATPNSEDPYRFRIFKTKTPDTPTGWTGLGDKAKIWYNKQVIYISDAAANSTAAIYTAAGELLKQITFNHNTTISTTDIPEGVYTVRVEDSVLKFFVKH